jgi:hypothetical protein
MERLERWVIGRIGVVAVVLVVIMVTLAGFTIWLVSAQHHEEGQLHGVKVAGPCRAFGPDDPECIRQSRLIMRSCVIGRGPGFWH